MRSGHHSHHDDQPHYDDYDQPRHQQQSQRRQRQQQEQQDQRQQHHYEQDRLYSQHQNDLPHREQRQHQPHRQRVRLARVRRAVRAWRHACVMAALCLLWPGSAQAELPAACRPVADVTESVASAPTTAARRSVVCGNIWVQAEVVPVFEALLQASPTLRRQVASIRRTERLTVSVMLADGCTLYHAPCHALTQFARYATGGSIAQVRIRRDTDLADALGHELEHICEWTEGALSPTLRLRRDGQDDTERARATGEQVRREHARWLRQQQGPRLRTP